MHDGPTMIAGPPRVLVIGAGSIGARHARNLASLGASVALTDPVAERAAAVSGVESYPFTLDRLSGFDGIVVASPTRFHLDGALVALATGARVLVEKPLASCVEGLDRLVEAGRDRLMVGYNLRLHEPVERLMSLAADGRVGPIRAARVWFGSYLPDWRPGVDYRSTYSARADLDGGVLLDAIHELDLVVWLLGTEFEVVGAAMDRLGTLEIDVEDTVKAVLRAQNGALVEVSLDYLSRRYRRGIEVIGDTGTLRLDWARKVLEVEDIHGIETSRADTPVSRSYERQAGRFLDWLRGEGEPPVDGATGGASLRVADRIRRAAR